MARVTNAKKGLDCVYQHDRIDFQKTRNHKFINEFFKVK